MSGTQKRRFGHTELPREPREALRRAIRIEWLTIGILMVTATLVFLVLGNSQAMRTAWIEDLLSFLPPIAFLVAARVIRRLPDEQHPYGYHRATGIAHIVAAVALLTMGGYLVVESSIALVTQDHPTIGGVRLFGNTIWLGWLMIGVMLLTAAPPVFLGLVKMKLAEQLHDKVLYADADMNKADWMTALAAAAGVAGLGVGLWWADAAAAILISLSILRDGVKNLRAAIGGVMDTRAMTFDDSKPHPLGEQVDDYLRGLDWVADARSRVRDEGHVFHIESFVVPVDGPSLSVDRLKDAREGCVDLDWKVQDLVIVPVDELPGEFLPGLRDS